MSCLLIKTKAKSDMSTYTPMDRMDLEWYFFKYMRK